MRNIIKQLRRIIAKKKRKEQSEKVTESEPVKLTYMEKKIEAHHGSILSNGENWEVMDKFLHLLLDKYLEQIENNLPQNNLFKKKQIAFRIPDTKNIGTLEVEALSGKPEDRAFITTVSREGTDQVFSNYIFRGTSSQVLDYLRCEEHFQEILDSVHELSDSIDEYWRS